MRHIPTATSVCLLLGMVALLGAAEPTRSAVVSTTEADGCISERFTVRSPGMGRDIRALVLLPPGYAAGAKRLPVLHTFHGIASPFDTFQSFPALRAALREHAMIVTCFDGDSRSWYLDAPNAVPAGRVPDDSTPVASRFTTFFFDEFIPCIDAAYRTDPDRRMLTGFSMGAFGAMHYALTRPERFCAVSCLSGAFRPTDGTDERMFKNFAPLLGSFAEHGERWTAIDLRARIAAVAERGGRLPPIHIRCGTEDKLLPFNRTLHELLIQRGFVSTFSESAGEHNYAYWSSAMPEVMAFHAGFAAP